MRYCVCLIAGLIAAVASAFCYLVFSSIYVAGGGISVHFATPRHLVLAVFGAFIIGFLGTLKLTSPRTYTRLIRKH